MALSPEELVVIAGLGGAAIGALPSLISTFINRRAEDKKNFNELVVKAAIENWKFIAENSQSRSILPMEHYIIHTAKMCEFALSGKPITPKTTEARLKEIDEVMVVLRNHAFSVSSKKEA